MSVTKNNILNFDTKITDDPFFVRCRLVGVNPYEYLFFFSKCLKSSVGTAGTLEIVNEHPVLIAAKVLQGKLHESFFNDFYVKRSL